jgi:thiamine monophosphate synthase
LRVAGVTPASFEELAGWGFAGAALLGTVWESEDPVAALAHALHVYETVDWNVR